MRWKVLTLILLLTMSTSSYGQQILGVGTESLIGNDNTDFGNDGVEDDYAPPTLGGFDAEFFSSDEPGFAGGEFAFNVFDNVLGPGNDKWCCGTEFPQIVGAIFPEPFVLESFTLSSANDTPDRDPRVWTIDGSNDGSDWTTVYEQNDPAAQVWTERLQVAFFENGVDYNSDTAYSQYRLSVTATNAETGAFFQVGELELFGGEPPILPVAGDSIGEAGVSAGIVDGSLTFGTSETGPGLAQEWFAGGKPWNERRR